VCSSDLTTKLVNGLYEKLKEGVEYSFEKLSAELGDGVSDATKWGIFSRLGKMSGIQSKSAPNLSGGRACKVLFFNFRDTTTGLNISPQVKAVLSQPTRVKHEHLGEGVAVAESKPADELE
jgi:hypothetical protein